MKDVIANKLSTLFGGKAPIKAGVGPKPDIRKEKADCLAQINDEIKKFDSEEIQVQLGLEVDQTVLKIQKVQGRILQEEKQFLNRLGKVEHLVADLKSQDSSQQQEIENLRKIDVQTSSQFAQFESARKELKAKLDVVISSKQVELSELKSQLSKDNGQTEELRRSIQTKRAVDADNVLS